MNLPEEKYGVFSSTLDMPPLINIDCSEVLRELAELVREALGFQGNLVFYWKRDGTRYLIKRTQGSRATIRSRLGELFSCTH